MLGEAVQYFRIPTAFQRLVTSLLCPDAPVEAQTFNNLVAMLRVALLQSEFSARVTIRPICVTDAHPKCGRAVGGIGNYVYGVECVADIVPTHGSSVNEDGSLRVPMAMAGLGTRKIRYVELVQTRVNGSRLGFADRGLRTEAETTCVGRTSSLQSRFAAHFMGDNRVSISG